MSQPLDGFFAPASIAVIGASQDPGKVRGRMVHNLKLSGFAGRIYPVHPSHGTVQGLPAFPSLSALPERPDLAMIAVPSAVLMPVLHECAEAGIRHAVVFSGVPMGPAGEEIQAAMGRLARDTGMRILGPNTLGFYRPLDRLAVTFAPLYEHHFQVRQGMGRRISIVAQSGGTAHGIFERCKRAGMNVADVLMPGNEADIDLVELADRCIAAGETGLLLLFVEGVKHGAAFAAMLARAADNDIPVIVLKIGGSEAGMRAAVSHTAHLTGSDAAYSAVFHKHGAVRVHDQEEMAAAATLLAGHAPLRGTKLAVVTTGGGIGGICADLLESAGFSLPLPGPELAARLSGFVPSHGSALNPIDVGTTMDDDGAVFCRTLEALQDDGDTDGVIAILNLGISGMVERMLPHLAKVDPQRKPVIFHSAAEPDAANIALLNDRGFPVTSLRQAVWAFGAAARRHRFTLGRAQRREPPAPAPASLSLASRREQQAALSAAGIAIAAEVLAASPDAAAEAAARIGFPVAVKIESADIAHKTEAGGVALALEDAAAVRLAAERILASVQARAPAARIDGLLVQKMLPPGREMMVGMTRDADFGPMMTLGFGGVDAEVLSDVVVAPAPLDLEDARDMIARLRGYPILRGTRGRPPADLDALARFLVAVSRLAMAAHDVDEFEFNPVIVQHEGGGACAADMLFVARQDGTAAQARPAA